MLVLILPLTAKPSLVEVPPPVLPTGMPALCQKPGRADTRKPGVGDAKEPPRSLPTGLPWKGKGKAKMANDAQKQLAAAFFTPSPERTPPRPRPTPTYRIVSDKEDAASADTLGNSRGQVSGGIAGVPPSPNRGQET